VSDLQAAGRTWVSWYASSESVDPFRFFYQPVLKTNEGKKKYLRGTRDEQG
jgi:hypothetical protein